MNPLAHLWIGASAVNLIVATALYAHESASPLLTIMFLLTLNANCAVLFLVVTGDRR